MIVPDKIVLINLKSRPDRLKRFYTQKPFPWPWGPVHLHAAYDAETQPIPQWWTDIPAQYGCRESHMSVIRDAICENIQNLWVMEDDCLFLPDAVPRIQEFLASIDSYDMLFIGGQHMKSGGYQRTHSYLLPAAGQRSLLDDLEMFPTAEPFDWSAEKWQLGKAVYAMNPFACAQAENYSSITGALEPARSWNKDQTHLCHRTYEEVPCAVLRCSLNKVIDLQKKGVVHPGQHFNPATAETINAYVAGNGTEMERKLKLHEHLHNLRREAMYMQKAIAVLWMPPGQDVELDGVPVMGIQDVTG